MKKNVYIACWTDCVANSWAIGFTTPDLRADFKRKMESFYGNDETGFAWLQLNDIAAYELCLDEPDAIPIYDQPVALDEHGEIFVPSRIRWLCDDCGDDGTVSYGDSVTHRCRSKPTRCPNDVMGRGYCGYCIDGTCKMA